MKRKLHKIKKINNELKYLDARIKFIEDIISGRLKIMNNKRQNIMDYLEDNEYPLHEKTYDYLIKMPIHNLTYEKKQELEKECKEKHLMLTNIENETEITTWNNDLEALNKKLI